MAHGQPAEVLESFRNLPWQVAGGRSVIRAETNWASVPSHPKPIIGCIDVASLTTSRACWIGIILVYTTKTSNYNNYLSSNSIQLENGVIKCSKAAAFFDYNNSFLREVNATKNSTKAFTL